MKCSRCAVELPDSATFCAQCGSPTYPDRPAASFSYLPAGAPPWPTTVPPQFSSTDYAQSIRSGDPSSNPVTKPKRSMRSIIGTTLLVILLPLIVAAVTLGSLYMNGAFAAAPDQKLNVIHAAATPTTPTAKGSQLPAPTSFKEAKNTDINIALQYPADWTAEATQKSSDSNFFGIHSSQDLGIRVIVIRYTQTSSSMFKDAQDVNKQNISYMGTSQNAHNVQTLPAPQTPPQIGGAQWDQQEISFSDDNGNKMHFTTIAVEHKKEYYNIVLIIPDVYQDEAMQKYIQPMLTSFQFLS